MPSVIYRRKRKSAANKQVNSVFENIKKQKTYKEITEKTVTSRTLKIVKKFKQIRRTTYRLGARNKDKKTGGPFPHFHQQIK